MIDDPDKPASCHPRFYDAPEGVTPVDVYLPKISDAGREAFIATMLTAFAAWTADYPDDERCFKHVLIDVEGQ